MRLGLLLCWGAGSSRCLCLSLATFLCLSFCHLNPQEGPLLLFPRSLFRPGAQVHQLAVGGTSVCGAKVLTDKSLVLLETPLGLVPMKWEHVLRG